MAKRRHEQTGTTASGKEFRLIAPPPNGTDKTVEVEVYWLNPPGPWVRVYVGNLIRVDARTERGKGGKHATHYALADLNGKRTGPFTRNILMLVEQTISTYIRSREDMQQ